MAKSSLQLRVSNPERSELSNGFAMHSSLDQHDEQAEAGAHWHHVCVSELADAKNPAAPGCSLRRFLRKPWSSQSVKSSLSRPG